MTFKVVNGAWDDGTIEDKTVTLTGYEGDKLMLAAKDITAVGSKSKKNYKAGSWGMTTTTKRAITEDTTYTYTYKAIDEKEAASVTKAPKVIDPTYNAKAQKLVTAGAAKAARWYMPR